MSDPLVIHPAGIDSDTAIDVAKRSESGVTGQTGTSASPEPREPDVGVVEESSQPPWQDREWDTYARTSFDFPRRLARTPLSLEAGGLYRHRELNPGDVFVPKAARPSLEAILDHHCQALQKVGQLRTQTAVREFRKLLKTCSAPTVSKAEAMARLPATERKLVAEAEDKLRAAMREAAGGELEGGVDIVAPSVVFPGREPEVYSVDGDRVSWADLDQLPVTKQAAELRALLVLQMGAQLVGWFEAHCQLPKARGVDLLHRAAELLE